jgi:hypothetical protein
MVDNGTQGDEVAQDGIYTALLTVTSDSTGTYAFTIEAADIVPNTGQVGGNITLDNTPPVFTGLVTLDEDTIYTNGETVLLLATFDAPGYTVTCDFSSMDTAYVSGAEAVEDNGDNTYAIRYTISETNSRPNGSYTVRATAADGVGLTGSGTITLVLDNAGPVVSNLALTDADDILNTDDVITATVTDDDANIQAAEFFVDVIGFPGEGTPMAAVDGSFDSRSEAVTAPLPIGTLSEGQHTLYVRGQDVSGEWGQVLSLIFVVDRVAPRIASVEVVYPEGQQAARRGQTVVVSALIYEETTQLDESSVLLKSADVDSNSSNGYVMVDNGTQGDEVAQDGIYTALLTVTSDSTGTYDFTIEAADIVPNTGQVGGNITLDNIAPSVFASILPAPVNGEIYVKEILMKGTYYDLPDSAKVKEIEIVVRNNQGHNVNTSPIIIMPNDEREFSRAVRLVEGENTVTVRITDFGGNIGRAVFVLTCINPAYTQYVDVGGGTIQSPDGTTITIPSDALLSGQTITIEAVPTRSYPEPMDNISLLEMAHELGPDGLTFHRTVTIQLTYSDSELDIDQDGRNDFAEDELSVFLLDGNVWIKAITDSRDVGNNTVTFHTNHFSVYALGNAASAEAFKMYWTKNPFTPDEGTTAVFELDQPGFITLKIVDLSGNIIRTIAERESVSGSTHWRWDGLNDFDRYVGSGIYIYIFEYEEDSGKKTMIKKPIGVVK